MGCDVFHHLTATYISNPTPFPSYSLSASIIPNFWLFPRPFEQPGESLSMFLLASASLGKLLLNPQSPVQPLLQPGSPPWLCQAPTTSVSASLKAETGLLCLLDFECQEGPSHYLCDTSKLLSLSGPRFPHYYQHYLPGLLGGVNALIAIKCLEACLYKQSSLEMECQSHNDWRWQDDRLTWGVLRRERMDQATQLKEALTRPFPEGQVCHPAPHSDMFGVRHKNSLPCLFQCLLGKNVSHQIRDVMVITAWDNIEVGVQNFYSLGQRHLVRKCAKNCLRWMMRFEECWTNERKWSGGKSQR